MDKQVRIGAGAGFAGDRWDPALELAEHGELDYLVFECLAERTIARENLARTKDPNAGFNPLLAERIRAVLPACAARGITIITNMGAANPQGAARRVAAIAAELGIGGLKIAAVVGDDVRETIAARPDLTLLETGATVASILPHMASANAYLGADAVLAALEAGADVVVTGRVADPSIFLAPAMHRLGWAYDDYRHLACGTAMGHLMECAGQITGGYFADPGKKDVAGLDRLGFPFADVSADGTVAIGKVAGSGGRIDRMTCTEQLLYEVHDPAYYITPDCVLDITGIRFEELGPDRVAVHGARAAPRTSTYKVSIGYFDGYIGEGQISYAGPNAVARARLAGEVVSERLRRQGHEYGELRVELIGLDSLHGRPHRAAEPYEVRLRVAGRTQDEAAARAVGRDVDTLLTNGPAGGAGATAEVRDIYAVQSVLLERDLVTAKVVMI